MNLHCFFGLGPHGFHRLSYAQWGDSGREPVLVCVHGLTRNGRDFDFLAQALERGRRVVCPDMPGRGRSEWLPAQDYGFPVYLSDMAALLARLDVEEVDWVGTSMGGIIGMMLAAQPGTPIRRLVLNDVGAFIPKDAVARISEYVGADPRFGSVDELEAYLRRVHAPFGPLTPDQWRHLAAHGFRQVEDGKLALHYDPGIAPAFQASQAADVVLWTFWDAIRCPVLVLRGERSDLLSKETAEEMKARGPGAGRVEVVEIPGVGHAPALLAEDQIGIVARWLARDVR